MQHVFRLREEAGVSLENLYMHGENMQSPYGKHPPEISDSESYQIISGSNDESFTSERKRL